MEALQARTARKRLDFRKQWCGKRALSTAYAPILESLTDRQLYAHTLKHDINGLLTPITAWNGHYGKSITSAMIPDLKDFHKRSEVILLQVTKLIALMAEVRAGTPKPLIFDPADEIKRSVVSIVHERKAVSTTISTNHTYLVNGCPLTLFRAFMNLLRNAADVVGSNGKIFIRSMNAPLQGEQFVLVSITDNGPGMDQETLDSAFNAEFTTKKTDHQGLGLVVVEHAIASYNGIIDVESTLEKGTTFTLSIPAIK